MNTKKSGVGTCSTAGGSHSGVCATHDQTLFGSLGGWWTWLKLLERWSAFRPTIQYLLTSWEVWWQQIKLWSTRRRREWRNVYEIGWWEVENVKRVQKRILKHWGGVCNTALGANEGTCLPHNNDAATCNATVLCSFGFVRFRGEMNWFRFRSMNNSNSPKFGTTRKTELEAVFRKPGPERDNIIITINSRITFLNWEKKLGKLWFY